MDLKVSLIEGGKKEFKHTRVYPSFLFFYSEHLSCSWRVRKIFHTQKGNLKLNGNVVYNFNFSDNLKCKIQEVQNGYCANWVEVEVCYILYD